MSKDFIDGLFVKKPSENAPEFIWANLDFNVEKFIEYLKSKANSRGFVNLQLLESKDGNLYAKLNEWKPSSDRKPTEHDMTEDEEINIGNIPF